jgi:isocitrate dehydrogenase
MSYFLFTWKTMMKVSDPIIFELLSKYILQPFSVLLLFNELIPRNGLGDVYAKIAGHLCKLKWKQH